MATVIESLSEEPLAAEQEFDLAFDEFDEPLPRWRDWDGWTGLVTVLIVAGSVLYTFVHLSPDLIVATTTPAGGDFGAHVWGPAYLRDHILPHWRLSGWAPDWYAGFPMYQYYMVVPALFVVGLNLALPYGVSLKIVSVLGILTLPICAYALGRLSGMPFPAPALMAVAATLYLWDETFTIYGGNVASTMAGEFSFSIALSFSVLYFGVLANGLRTGRYRAWAASLFALACLCHGIVAIFTIIGTVVMFLLFADLKRLKYVATFLPIGAALTAFWMLPFLLQRTYLTDMGYEKRTDYMRMLFPFGLGANIVWMAAILIGLTVSIMKGRRLGVFLAVMMVVYGVWTIVQPQSQLWNARLLPFLYLSRYLLAAIGVADIATALAKFVARGRGRADARLETLWAPVPWSVAAIFLLGIGFRDLPFGTTKVVTHNNKTDWVYHWGPFHSTQSNFVDDWARWNYKGYERKDAYAEYYNLVSAMKVLGYQRGCGRAVWENNNVEDRYGTPMALMLLPFWTDGCIASMEGLFFESSATTPYHFLTTGALSDHSSNPVRRLRYDNSNVDIGVMEAQELGVRYYLAFSADVVSQANKNPALTKVANSGPWHIYEIANHDIVTPLAQQPVVVPGAGSSRDRWLELGTSYFQDPQKWLAVPAQSGPPEWQRIELKRTSAQPTNDRSLAVVAPSTIASHPLPAVKIGNITQRDDRVSFDVDQVGVPVLVKVSYFPNWAVSGGRGPWRVAPNLMVVIPTSTHVSLHYGRTTTDWAGLLVTGFGLIGLGLLARRRMNFDVRPASAGAPLPPPVPYDEAVTPSEFWVDWQDSGGVELGPTNGDQQAGHTFEVGGDWGSDRDWLPPPASPMAGPPVTPPTSPRAEPDAR